MKIRILSILLLLVLLLTACNSAATVGLTADPYAGVDIAAMEYKFGNKDYSLNKVMVLMTNEASLQFIDYTPEHFSDVGCVAVSQLDVHEREGVQEVVNSGEKNDKYDPAEYHALLILRIEPTDPAGLFKTCTILENREDVSRANPNYLFRAGDPTGRPAEEIYKDHEFANNAIIVTLTLRASLLTINDTYTTEDFSEIGCIKVVEWNPGGLEQARAEARGENVDAGRFMRRLILYLGEQTRENVFHAITAVEQREDIEIARPNFTD